MPIEQNFRPPSSRAKAAQSFQHPRRWGLDKAGHDLWLSRLNDTGFGKRFWLLTRFSFNANRCPAALEKRYT